MMLRLARLAQNTRAAPTLEDAIMLAAEAHCGQIYPSAASDPFVLHPLRLLVQARSHLERVVAVLHDVIEDTDYTLDDLCQMGYAEEVVAALDCLTRRPGETYAVYIDRVATNPTARRVKQMDLADNLANNLSLKPTDATLQRIAQYQAAQERLQVTDHADSSTGHSAAAPNVYPDPALIPKPNLTLRVWLSFLSIP